MFQTIKLCCVISSQTCQSGNVNVFSQMTLIMLIFKNATIIVSHVSLTILSIPRRQPIIIQLMYSFWYIHTICSLLFGSPLRIIYSNLIVAQGLSRCSVTWRCFILYWCISPLKCWKAMSYRSNALFPQSTDLIILPPLFVRIPLCFPPDMIRNDVPVSQMYHVIWELHFLLGGRRENVAHVPRPGCMSHHVTWLGTLAFSCMCLLGSLLQDENIWIPFLHGVQPVGTS